MPNPTKCLVTFIKFLSFNASGSTAWWILSAIKVSLETIPSIAKSRLAKVLATFGTA